ncbi:serine/threonine protein kinase, partial [Streptomyces sp. SID10815]|nr:serine/threonine protein kinase [Streptomyces sp. SID10815]
MSDAGGPRHEADETTSFVLRPPNPQARVPHPNNPYVTPHPNNPYATPAPTPAPPQAPQDAAARPSAAGG